MLKKYAVVGAVSLALGLSVTPASAATVTIDLINDAWANPVGGSNVAISNSANPGSDLIYWGAVDADPTTPSGPNRSGYIWDSTDVSFNVSTDVAFMLGMFTHENFVIPSAGDAIDTVDLQFEVGTFDGPTTLSTTFLFTHDETNNAGPCPVGVPPCPDIVTIGNTFFNTPITIGGVPYFFTLLGFSPDGMTFSNNYVTTEGQVNTTDLYAIITTRPIPEPSALLLLGLGLVGFARAVRRR